MKTKLLIPVALQRYSKGDLEITFEGNTVGELLQALQQTNHDLYNCVCDETGRLRRHINVFLDNKLADRSNLDQVIDSGVVVSVFQAVSGG